MINKISKDTNEMIKTCVNLLEDKHVIDIKIYDVREKSSITDFFLIGSVRNDRQMKAAGGNLVRQLKKLGIKSSHKDGEMDNTWVVLDFIDCIIHLFTTESREHYNIQELWEGCEMNLDD